MVNGFYYVLTIVPGCSSPFKYFSHLSIDVRFLFSLFSSSGKRYTCRHLHKTRHTFVDSLFLMRLSGGDTDTKQFPLPLDPLGEPLANGLPLFRMINQKSIIDEKQYTQLMFPSAEKPANRFTVGFHLIWYIIDTFPI